MLNALLATLLVLTSLYATGCVALYFVQDDMIFPGKNVSATPTPILPPSAQCLTHEFAPG